jgi:short-subunit dehydrogenase
MAARVLVTGAARGIGRAIASALAGCGYEVLGTTRTLNSLPRDTKIPGVSYLPLDLTDEKSTDALVARAGDIDILVNNAGGGQIGPVGEMPVGAMRRLFELNLFGSVRLTQGFLPAMRARHSGRVIFVSSIAGVSPVPFLSVYAATKAALTALARGLRQEVMSDGIWVSVIAPFDIHTTIPLDLQFTANSPSTAALMRVKEVRDRSLEKAPEPTIVARMVLRILAEKKPRAFYAVGRNARLLGFLLKHLPDWFVERDFRKRFRIDG